MNFLLQTIGRPFRQTSTGPGNRHALLRTASTAATKGDFRVAVSAYEVLPNHADDQLMDALLLAGLYLASENLTAATERFEYAASHVVNDISPQIDPDNGDDDHHENWTPNRFTELQPEPPEFSETDALEYLINRADACLRAGHYIRATSLFQSARHKVDFLLAAHAGITLAHGSLDANTHSQLAAPLVPLVKLGDLLLRMLARTHLSANLAVGLRQQALRDDLAPWATSTHSVDLLLDAEFNALHTLSRAYPAHAENNYRLGLVARALGRLDEAACAFNRVLAIHPHHASSANRLAATLLQLDRPKSVTAVLASAYHIPREALAQYHAFAIAAGQNSRAFDRAADRLLHDPARNSPKSVGRANLAFALSELGLLNEERSVWREATATATV